MTAVLSFDCYGTLIDWETGIWEALRPLPAGTGRAEALAAFGRMEAAQQAATPSLPYPEILARVRRTLASELGEPPDPARDRAFGASVGTWPPFADSAAALRRLGAGHRLVVLSNVDRAGFAASARLLGIEFDAVYTAQDIGTYKPDPANFAFLIDRVQADFGTGPEGILHVAQSLYHDIAPAARAGLATAWIDRARLSEGGSWGATMPVADLPEPDHVFFTLSDLATAFGR